MSPLRKPIAALSSLTTAVRKWLLARGWGRALLESFKAYEEHGCGYMTSALSFYAVVSLIPLAFIALWSLTRIIGSSAGAQEYLNSMLHQFLLPKAADDVMDQAEVLFETSLLSLFGAWWAIVAFLWSGVRFYEMLHLVLTRAWGGGSSRPFLERKAWTIMAFVVAGLFFGLTMMTTASVTTLSRLEDIIPGIALANFEAVVAWVLPWLFSIAMIYLLYKYMPRAYVPWRLALGAAVPVGITWELVKHWFASIVADTGFFSSIYGPMATLVLLMVWIYASANIVLFGAEYAAAWEKQYYPGNGPE
jgi:membrane protein